MSYFNPRSPRRERQEIYAQGTDKDDISIHAPREGSDHPLTPEGATSNHFNPRSPRRERLGIKSKHSISAEFQSTLPAKGATDFRLLSLRRFTYFNPRSPRRERHVKHSFLLKCRISIHAPREGSDSTVKACSNDRIKRSTLREPHFLYSKNACFSPISPLCATTSRTKNQRIIVSFGSYPGLAPMCFTLDWYRFPRL